MMYHFSTLYINLYIFIILYNTFLYNKKCTIYNIYIKNNIKNLKKDIDEYRNICYYIDTVNK